MKIALCAPFMEADLWQKRLEGLWPPPLRVDEFNRPADLYTLPSLTGYDGVWVVLDGAEGLETVARTRERDGHVPIVWVRDDTGGESGSRLLPGLLSLSKHCADKDLAGVLGWLTPTASKN